jgi:hypothetical protein
MTAVQYSAVTTLHPLFRLGIDEELVRNFQFNIGRHNIHARHLPAANLIIIEVVLILTRGGK